MTKLLNVKISFSQMDLTIKHYINEYSGVKTFGNDEFDGNEYCTNMISLKFNLTSLKDQSGTSIVLLMLSQLLGINKHLKVEPNTLNKSLD